MFCNDVFAGGGIHRFKEHLAKYPGNVAPCKKVDPEVEHAMFQNIEDWKEKKKKAQQDYEKGKAASLFCNLKIILVVGSNLTLGLLVTVKY